MLPGVRPSICWASVPTFSSLPVFLSSATTDGSRKTMPLSLIYTNTLAVPRSIPISFANIVIHSCIYCALEVCPESAMNSRGSNTQKGIILIILDKPVICNTLFPKIFIKTLSRFAAACPALLNKNTRPPAVLLRGWGPTSVLCCPMAFTFAFCLDSALGFRLKLLAPCFCKQCWTHQTSLASGAFIKRVWNELRLRFTLRFPIAKESWCGLRCTSDSPLPFCLYCTITSAVCQLLFMSFSKKFDYNPLHRQGAVISQPRCSRRLSASLSPAHTSSNRWPPPLSRWGSALSAPPRYCTRRSR